MALRRHLHVNQALNWGNFSVSRGGGVEFGLTFVYTIQKPNKDKQTWLVMWSFNENHLWPDWMQLWNSSYKWKKTEVGSNVLRKWFDIELFSFNQTCKTKHRTAWSLKQVHLKNLCIMGLKSHIKTMKFKSIQFYLPGGVTAHILKMFYKEIINITANQR